MKPAPFRYIRAQTVSEAVSLLSGDEDAKIIAGGQSLVPLMNFRMAQPDVLIDVNHLSELSFIRLEGDELVIGGITRHREIRDSAVVRQAHPLLGRAYQFVAHETVRNRGTIGGNLAHADPASEIPAVLLALDGKIVLQSVRGRRVVGAADFFIGALAPDLEPDELLVEVRIPGAGVPAGVGFEEYALRKGDLALSGAAVLLSRDGERCTAARISMFGIADRPLRFADAERTLTGVRMSEAALHAARDEAVASVTFEDGLGVTAEYRRDLSRTLLGRALTTAWQEGQEQ
jgi:carbon-monoxide dehydrogenase medium subunit